MEKFLENYQITLLNSGEYTRHNATRSSFLAIDLTISNSAFAPELNSAPATIGLYPQQFFVNHLKITHPPDGASKILIGIYTVIS